MTDDGGIFPKSRKRRTLGTIPVTLNLKEDAMKVGEFLDKDSLKVTRKEALAISRQTLKRAEQERMEDRMELKPLNKMTLDEIKQEINVRTGLWQGQKYQESLSILRERHIGDENLKPPEPDWKRWRKWPDEKPIPFTHVEWELKSPQCAETGIYIPFESVALPFRKGLGRGVGSGVCCWRYLKEPPCCEEPPRWKNVERDGNPSEAGWYEVPPNMGYRRFRYWDGACWNLYWGGSICCNPTDYCEVAPAPKFED